MFRFLLVSLSIDAILGEVTIRQRRKKLEETTQGNGLSDAYTATLARLKAQKGYKSVLGMKVLMWVSYSERPLKAQELRHALGVEIGSADHDPENLPALRTLLESCLGLVTLESSSSIVRPVHLTLQEHLSRDPTLFHSPHSEIAEACLTYLNFGCIRNLSPIYSSAPETTPLLEYASVYWGSHSSKGITEIIKILALRLLDRFDEHISAHLLLLHYNTGDRAGGPGLRGEGEPKGFLGLHGAAFLGIEGIVSRVLEMKEWDVNAYDCTGMTPLTWASMKGHGEVVKVLLQRADVNPDQADTLFGQPPLSWASMRGHGEIVKVLLQRADVNPDRSDIQYGRTPLAWAAEKGHEGVVKMLLEREDVNPDRTDRRSGRTPLSWAVKEGHEGVVKMLLQRGDVNPDLEDTRYGRTLLSWAAEKGHEGVVRMLLEREDVNPDRADTMFGMTPLSRAAKTGHEGIVKMLLDREDVNPDHPATRTGQTPLAWAAEKGHEGVVKILLEREDVNTDREDTEYGRTPLSWATKMGHEGIVKMLTERKAPRTAMPDSIDQTPPSLALSEGHDVVVRIPQAWGTASCATTHRRGPTSSPTSPPPSSLPLGECVVEMQFTSHGHNTDMTDPNGQPVPLLGAHNEQPRLLDPQISVSKSDLEPSNVDQAAADGGAPRSLPPTSMPLGECVVEMQPISHDPNTDLTDPSGQPVPLPAASDQRPRLLNSRGSVSGSADNGLPTQSPGWSQHLSIWPLKLCCCGRKSKTHPSST